jgi:hypothetical protein
VKANASPTELGGGIAPRVSVTSHRGSKKGDLTTLRTIVEARRKACCS